MAPITPNYCLTQEILSNDFTEKKNYVVDNKKYRYLEYSCLKSQRWLCLPQGTGIGSGKRQRRSHGPILLVPWAEGRVGEDPGNEAG